MSRLKTIGPKMHQEFWDVVNSTEPLFDWENSEYLEWDLEDTGARVYGTNFFNTDGNRGLLRITGVTG